ncbi:MAG TPA: 1-deoxy-D-xylulose-5-phosphate reductoisomerase [Candidatus Hydrogenedentes bacterium]|nr:1-deoxy-D-xylulose-5-phosphate reductoisomerase [Candidatus Hydrogenedentota bacterium]
MNEPLAVTVFGSTGAIGRATLEVIRQYPERFQVRGLAAHRDIDTLSDQIAEFHPEAVAVIDANAAKRLRDRGPACVVLDGMAGCNELATRPVHRVVCGMVGTSGLAPLLAALDAGNTVALANKEPMVMAGHLVMRRARDRGVYVLPVDSEHSALFQCMAGHPAEHVRRLWLTASGGPFYGKSRKELTRVSPAEASRHPTWRMGVKISVDSATLMNKGLEIIEAMRLFGMPRHRIEVIIHPQSIVHGLVEFTDGNMLAHLGVTDMKLPILYALTWPDRAEQPVRVLDLTSLGGLTFHRPDLSEFPCLGLAMEAADRGGTAPAVLNAANEVAVEAFRAERIGFLDIADVVAETLAGQASAEDGDSLEAILAADSEARRVAEATVIELERKKR